MTKPSKKSPLGNVVSHTHALVQELSALPPEVLADDACSHPQDSVPLAGLEPHSFALIFPAYSKTELADLACDIREHGLREPVWIFQGKVLDGWNRVQACQIAGLTEVCFRLFPGDEAAAQTFVFSMNMLRRHLTDDQRAAIAARFATMEHGGDRKSGGLENRRRRRPSESFKAFSRTGKSD